MKEQQKGVLKKMDAAEAKEAFLSESPVLWKDLITEREYEFPYITALTYRRIRGEKEPVLQLEVTHTNGCPMIIHPWQTRKKG